MSVENVRGELVEVQKAVEELWVPQFDIDSGVTVGDISSGLETLKADAAQTNEFLKNDAHGLTVSGETLERASSRVTEIAGENKAPDLEEALAAMGSIAQAMSRANELKEPMRNHLEDAIRYLALAETALSSYETVRATIQEAMAPIPGHQDAAVDAIDRYLGQIGGA